jgi:hypothetical protein
MSLKIARWLLVFFGAELIFVTVSIVLIRGKLSPKIPTAGEE